MLSNFTSVLLFFVIGLIFLAITLLLSRLIQVWRPHPSKGMRGTEKYIPYECGELPEGQAWIRFNIRFYVLALIFIIFDVEIVFLLPWAVVFKKLGTFAYVEGLIFIAILVVGLAYVWKKGDLNWVKSDDLEAMKQ